MSEIKPCPFCGKTGTTILTTIKDCEECFHFEDELCPMFEGNEICYFKIVVCACGKGGCGASSGWKTSEEEAIEAWNARAACCDVVQNGENNRNIVNNGTIAINLR